VCERAAWGMRANAGPNARCTAQPAAGMAARPLTIKSWGCSVMAPGAAGSREMHQREATDEVTGSPCGASSCLRRLPAVAGEASSSSEAAASNSRPVAALCALMLGSVVVAQLVSDEVDSS